MKKSMHHWGQRPFLSTVMGYIIQQAKSNHSPLKLCVHDFAIIRRDKQMNLEKKPKIIITEKSHRKVQNTSPMKSHTQKIVIAAMMAALTCIATMIIKIPSPMKGYINLGDCVVLLAGWLLSPMYGFLAAGIGSALADFFSGYMVYVPATFIIKGLMALIAGYVIRTTIPKIKKHSAYILSGLLAESMMVLGYLFFESFLYGFVPSLVNVPANGVQGAAGLVLGAILIRSFDKMPVFK